MPAVVFAISQPSEVEAAELMRAVLLLARIRIGFELSSGRRGKRKTSESVWLVRKKWNR